MSLTVVLSKAYDRDIWKIKQTGMLKKRERGMNNRVTIKDIAKACDTSVGTVSRALSGNGYVEKSKKEHIIAVAQSYHYSPDTLRKKKKSTKSMRVGIVLSDCSMPFLAKTLFYMQENFEELGYDTVLYNTRGSMERIHKIIDLVECGKLDGLVVSTNVSRRDIKRLMDIPVVSLECDLGSGIPLVTSDHVRGGELAAKLLYRNGCKNVAIFSLKTDTPVYARHRIQTCMEQLKKKHVRTILMEKQYEHVTYEVLQEMINEFMNMHQDIDGIFTEDMEAYYSLLQAKKRGIRVPQDLKIVGYDGHDITNLVSPKVTTIVQNTKELGKTCANVLVDSINGKDMENLYLVPVKIRKGGTTE